MMRLFYTLLYAAVLFCVLPYQFFKRPAGLRLRWLKERTGIIPDRSSRPAAGADSPAVWIHAVSVGEVIASTPLVRGIKERFPDADIIVSTVTDTGQAVARERMGSLSRICYVPFDLPFAIKNFVMRSSPSLFIVMETELWPNLLRIVRGHGIPIVLMNGRISESSFKGYLRAGVFIRTVLRDIDMFCMQNAIYADRIIRLGAPVSSVATIGNLKFDTVPPRPAPEWASSLPGVTIVAGSTHDPEEAFLLGVYLKLTEAVREKTRLIIAPRHPERFREVDELIRSKPVRSIRRSEIGTLPAGGRDDPQVVLLDVMGELSSVYGACDIAVMGGSFTDHGGQNLLEPAFWAKAIVCGPHMENFPFAEDFFREGGALRAQETTLLETLEKLVLSPETRAALGTTARRLYDANTGATARAISLISPYIELSSGTPRSVPTPGEEATITRKLQENR